MKISINLSERSGFDERNSFLYLLLGLVSLSSSLLRSAAAVEGEPAPAPSAEGPPVPTVGRLLR